MPKSTEEFEPASWTNPTWRMTKPRITKGNRKCRTKKRARVAPLTAKPPHSQNVIDLPTKGRADTRFVITVAPQKLICPQGRTYPMKAVAILSELSSCSSSDQVARSSVKVRAVPDIPVSSFVRLRCRLRG